MQGIKAQNLYVKTFGYKSSTPLVFLHGGPGFNSANFERTTAEKLSDEGFFVVIYDRRGEGRSTDRNAKFKFKETFKDILSISDSLGLESLNFLGHSFGGVVATKFAVKYPKKVNSIVLIGAPVSLQETFKTILRTCKDIYTEKKNTENLRYIKLLEDMDSTTMEYAAYCFTHALQNGFYFADSLSEDAKIIYQRYRTDSVLIEYGSKMEFEAPQGFSNNEQYTTIDLSDEIKTLKKSGIQLFGLYGKEDGLYSNQQVEDLRAIIGKDRLKYLDNCSHNVFIDRQEFFIKSLKDWLN